jgi:hypothetical protein
VKKPESAHAGCKRRPSILEWPNGGLQYRNRLQTLQEKSVFLRYGVCSPQCVRMTPNPGSWTLTFDDPELESEMRAGQLRAAFPLFSVSSALAMIMLEIAGCYRTLMIVAFLACLLILVLIRPGWLPISFALPEPVRPHSVVSALWLLGWAMPMPFYWIAIFRGTLARLGPGDAQQMVCYCCLWFIILVFQHGMCFSMLCRAPVYLHAMTLIWTSPHWGTHLAAAMIVGETGGPHSGSHKRGHSPCPVNSAPASVSTP